MTAEAVADTSVTGHIRGSLLLLAGRLGSLAVTFGAQMVVVRYLSRTEYGAFAWSMAVVMLLQGVLPLGMDRVDSRYLAFYDERGEHHRLIHLVVFETVLITGLGVVVTLGVALSRQSLVEAIHDPRALSVLLVVIALGPTQAVDMLTSRIFATVASARAVFWRQYVVTPLTRAGAVALTVSLGQGVMFLAGGYLVAGLATTVIYMAMAAWMLRARSRGWWRYSRGSRLPERTFIMLAVGGLLGQLVAASSTEFAGILLGWYHSVEEVADYRAIQPLAMLNFAVHLSFSTIYRPRASRAFARGDDSALRRMYWSTGCWITLLTAPVFLATVALSSQTTVLVLSGRYSASAPLLAIVSVGYFINASAGFLSSTLTVLGKWRFQLITNIGLLVFSLILQFTLIPPLGSVGAALSVLVTMVAITVVGKVGLRGTGIGWMTLDAAKTYGSVLFVGVALALLGWTGVLSIWMGIVAGAVGSLVVVYLNRRRVDLAGVIPEIARVPILGRVLS